MRLSKWTGFSAMRRRTGMIHIHSGLRHFNTILELTFGFYSDDQTSTASVWAT